MLHPQIGSEGTGFRSDFFHLSLKYMFVQLDHGQDPQDEPGKGTAAAVRIAIPTSVCCLKPK